jgi:hypothetical protein
VVLSSSRVCERSRSRWTGPRTSKTRMACFENVATHAFRTGRDTVHSTVLMLQCCHSRALRWLLRILYIGWSGSGGRPCHRILGTECGVALRAEAMVWMVSLAELCGCRDACRRGRCLCMHSSIVWGLSDKTVRRVETLFCSTLLVRGSGTVAP